jgi:tetratricopeptide (TPR) repeat protein
LSRPRQPEKALPREVLTEYTMPPASPCPEPEELEHLLRPQAEPWEVEHLASHLEECARCGEILERLLERDELVAALGASAAAGGEEAEGDAVRRLMARLRRLPETELPDRGPGTETPFPRDPGRTPTGFGPPGPEAEACDFLAPPQGPDEIGRLASYGILRVLGRGGMGTVFQARQTRPQRLVALKMILAGRRAGREQLTRFRSEAEVVARLQHLHIVQIHEVGEYDGRPYYAMEFVAGGSLADKLAAAPLAAPAAAQLVQTLARAVQHAHERGIIHRDLKPSNILLAGGAGPAEEWVAKITDFGLAKQFEGEAEACPWAPRTESGAILGTPGYMAPEQATGRADLGPAADVYALGAILYECLTGRPPFKAATVLETLEQVRSQEPVPPGRLQPGLPRDLQTVCLKCLQKEPARRYASAAELADDLRRFLGGEPIRARPVGPAERLRKWVRRKPAQAALLAVSALSLAVLGAVSLMYQARLRAAVEQAQGSAAEARWQQERADAGYRSARETLNRMLGRLEARRLGELPRLKELQHDLLADALVFYQGHLEGANHPNPAVRRDAAWAYERAGTIQLLLGRNGVVAENFGRALELIDGLPAADRDDPESQDLLAAGHDALALLANQALRWGEAEQQHRAALAIREKLALARPNDPAAQRGLAKTEHYLGVVCWFTKRPGEAERHYARAVSLLTGLVRTQPRQEQDEAALADNHVNLALLYQNSGRPAEATLAYEKVEALLRPLVARHPPGGEYALSLAAAYTNWGYILAAAHPSDAALDRLNQAVELAEAVLREEPRLPRARLRAFNSHGGRAELHAGAGRHAEAVRDWDRVIELDDQPAPWIRRVLRARALARAGEHARAAAEADVLERDAAVNADGLYDLAGAYALSMTPARSDARLPSAERTALAERYATRAVALLRKLHDKGYFKDPAHAKALRTDEDLQPLRGRADFQKLLE